MNKKYEDSENEETELNKTVEIIYEKKHKYQENEQILTNEFNEPSFTGEPYEEDPSSITIRSILVAIEGYRFRYKEQSKFSNLIVHFALNNEFISSQKIGFLNENLKKSDYFTNKIALNPRKPNESIRNSMKIIADNRYKQKIFPCSRKIEGDKYNLIRAIGFQWIESIIEQINPKDEKNIQNTTVYKVINQLNSNEFELKLFNDLILSDYLSQIELLQRILLKFLSLFVRNKLFFYNEKYKLLEKEQVQNKLRFFIAQCYLENPSLELALLVYLRTILINEENYDDNYFFKKINNFDFKILNEKLERNIIIFNGKHIEIHNNQNNLIDLYRKFNFNFIIILIVYQENKDQYSILYEEDFMYKESYKTNKFYKKFSMFNTNN